MKPWLRNAVIIGVGIMFFQQFVGINTVIYYSPKIFLMAGFDGAVSAIWAAVGVGVVNLLFTIVSVYFVDRLGRRKLYFTGLTGILSLFFYSVSVLLIFLISERWVNGCLLFSCSSTSLFMRSVSARSVGSLFQKYFLRK